jgi:predicted metal-dependent hydrolase
MCNENMCGGCGGGCNCSSEITSEMLEKKEKWLKEKLAWVEKKKKELESSDK